MTNLNVRIIATANMAQAQAGLAKLTAQTQALNAAMAQTATLQNGVNPKGYALASAALAQNSATFRNAAASTGMFEVAQLKVNSATEDYIKLLQKQKVGLRKWRESRAIANDAFREQIALQEMMIRQVGTTSKGQGIFDVAHAPMVNRELNTSLQRMRFLKEEIRSVAQQTVNWGKNTQWAGRQLMVGFTMPIAAFGAATGVMAYQVDKQLTRIQKVYDTTADANNKTTMGQMAVERELAMVRDSSMATATNAARDYGASITDTLEVQAELAATGLKGSELQERTNEVMKNATLGEIDHQVALKATIALQTVFRKDVQQTADAWAYMNSVENATSLAMADFAEAIPIAAAPIEKMGGNVEELGTLLVAMKERGIEAAQGANAIKAMMQRLYRPSKQIREEFQAITGADLGGIVDKNKGNIMDMLSDIAKATEDLNRPGEIKALAGLFGTYQVTRMSAMLGGIRDLEKGIGQVSSANEIAGQTATDWRKVQERELQRMRDSIQGQFNIALQSLKAEMADVGMTFLKVATGVLKAVTGLVKAFNNLPEGVKNFALVSAILLALAGPAVMLTGLFANLVGTIGKMGISLADLGGKFKLVTREQKVAELASELTTAGWLKEGTAADALAVKLRALAQAQHAANMETIVPANIGSVNAWRAGGMQGPLPNLQTTPLPPGLGGSLAEDKIMSTTEKMADDAEKANKSMRRAAVGMGIFSAAAATSMITTNETAQNIANMTMLAMALGPALGGAFSLLKNVKWGEIGSSISTKIGGPLKNVGANTSTWLKNFKTAPSIAGHLGTGIKGIGAGIVGFLGPMGLFTAGLAAAGTAAYFIYKNITKARDEVNNIYRDSEGLGDILGYTPTEDPDYINEAGDAVENMSSLSAQFADKFGAVVEAIRSARTPQEKFNIAMAQGLKVINEGGTAEQARKAIHVALNAAVDRAEAERIILQFEARMDFDSPVNIIRQELGQAQRNLEQAQRVRSEKGFWEGIWSESASKESLALVESAGEAHANAYNRALDTGMNRVGIENRIKRQLEAFQKQLAEFDVDPDNISTVGEVSPEEMRYLEVRSQYEEYIATIVKGRVGDEEDFADAASDSLTFLELMGKANMDVEDSIKRTELGVRDGASRFDIMEDRVNDTRRAVIGTTGATKLMGKEAEKTAMSMKKIREAFPMSSVRDLAMGGMQTTLDQLGEIAQQNFEDKMNAAMDSYQAAQEHRMDVLRNSQEIAQRQLNNRHEREQRRLDDAWEDRMDKATDRWDNREEKINDVYDGRIERINDAIQAEERAEETRQRIFQAEVTRIQRLADMMNMNIDFNVALNEGDLDEAAKIRNDAMAQEAEWAGTDEMERSTRRSERKTDRLGDRVENIEKLKETRLEAFEDERKAFFKHLEKVERAEKRSLENRHESEVRAMENLHKKQERFLEKEIDNNVDAQREIWENRKRNVDRAIELFRNYVPKNEADLKRHIKRISEQYGDFNVRTRGKFNTTAVQVGNMLTRNVKDAARAMVNEIQWDIAGNKMAKDIINGAFGLTPRQFQRWMVTGVWPKGSRPPTLKQLRSQNAEQLAADRQSDVRINRGPGGINATVHTGGYLGGPVMPDNRKGVPRTAPQSRKEVNLLAERGEYVIQKDTVAKYGKGFFDQINSGKIGNDFGDTGGKYATGGMGMGFSGVMASIMAAAIRSTVRTGTNQGAKALLQRQARQSAMGSNIVSGTRYDLPGVKPWVQEAADFLGQKYGIGTILGVGQRNNVSDHPLGLALDFMTSNQNIGDALAAQVIRMNDVLDATYVIWRQRINSFDGRGWRGMEDRGSPTANHFDHVHVSFQKTGDLDGLVKYGFGQDGMVAGPGGRHRPVIGGRLTQGLHDVGTGYPSIDIGIPVGTPVRAVGDGVISDSYDIRGHEPRISQQNGYRSYGKLIKERLNSGGSVLYAHLNSRLARKGQAVKGGTVIGRSGNTGYSFGPHLHFGATPMSPYSFMGLDKGAQNINVEGLYRLHQNEAVLTEDINNKFKQGVENFANGPQNTYNIDMIFAGDVNDRPGMRRFILDTIKAAENRKPQDRTGRD